MHYKIVEEALHKQGFKLCIDDTNLSPAYTDFTSIFVKSNLSPEELTLLVRHELYHNHAQHNFRHTKHFANKKCNPGRWAYAVDYELAKNIYSEKDCELINSPRSILHNGVLPNNPEIPPELTLAEDIYDWICKNNVNVSFPLYGNHVGNNNYPAAVKSSIEIDPIQADKLFQQAVAHSHQQIEIQKRIKQRLTMKRTIASEIDSLAQSAIRYEPSYARLSRRPSLTKIINKGHVLRYKRPQIILYVDCSGSFTPEKTEVAEQRVAKLIAQYGHKLTLSTFYFSGDKIAPHRIAPGNTPYYLVSKHIDTFLPKLAIIITDSDGHNSYSPPNDVRLATLACGCSSAQALNRWKIHIRDLA